MGVITQTGATGIGSLALGVSTGVTEVYMAITAVGPDAQVSGGAGPHKAFHIGWVALGYAAGGGYPDFVSWFTYVEWDAYDPRAIAGSILTYADTIFWSLQPGVVIDLEVYW